MTAQTAVNVTAAQVSTREAAQRRLARIRDALVVADGLLVEAWKDRDWEALGHDSWDAYCAAELPRLRLIAVTRDERKARNVALAADGMTVRAIVSAYGGSVGTVARDLEGAARPDVVVSTDGRRRASRVQRPEPTPAPAGTRADEVVALVAAAGPAGLTCLQLERKLRAHHGIASGALSRVARQGRVVRVGSRDGWGVYVVPAAGQ